jgi:hypothetical protein
MKTCAVCDKTSEGNYAIHRYAMGVGREVWLCDGCGSKTTPTCEQIWSWIRGKKLPKSAFVPTKSKKQKAKKHT